MYCYYGHVNDRLSFVPCVQMDIVVLWQSIASGFKASSLIVDLHMSLNSLMGSPTRTSFAQERIRFLDNTFLAVWLFLGHSGSGSLIILETKIRLSTSDPNPIALCSSQK